MKKIIAIFSFFFFFPISSAFSFDLYEIRGEMLKAVNFERQQNEKSLLVLQSQLNEAAQKHAEWMRDTNTLSHTGPNGQTFKDRMRAAGYMENVDFEQYDAWLGGENVAFGQKNVEEVMKMWINSEFHRGNILNSRFADFGLGVACGESEKDCYWVQVFGVRKLKSKTETKTVQEKEKLKYTSFGTYSYKFLGEYWKVKSKTYKKNDLDRAEIRWNLRKKTDRNKTTKYRYEIYENEKLLEKKDSSKNKKKVFFNYSKGKIYEIKIFAIDKNSKEFRKISFVIEP